MQEMQEAQVWFLGWEVSPGEGSGSPRQCFCLENPMEWGAMDSTVHGVAKSQAQLSTSTFIHFHTVHGFRPPLGVFEYPLWIRRSHCIMMMIHNFIDEKKLQESCSRWHSKWLSEMLNPGHLTIKPVSYNKIQFKVIRSACRIVFCPWAMS